MNNLHDWLYFSFHHYVQRDRIGEIGQVRDGVMVLTLENENLDYTAFHQGYVSTQHK